LSQYVLLLIPAWLLTTGVCAVWGSLLATSGYKAGLFLAYRSLNLTSGVAPGVPILALAVAFCTGRWFN